MMNIDQVKENTEVLDMNPLSKNEIDEVIKFNKKKIIF